MYVHQCSIDDDFREDDHADELESKGLSQRIVRSGVRFERRGDPGCSVDVGAVHRDEKDSSDAAQSDQLPVVDAGEARENVTFF